MAWHSRPYMPNVNGTILAWCILCSMCGHSKLQVLAILCIYAVLHTRIEATASHGHQSNAQCHSETALEFRITRVVKIQLRRVSPLMWHEFISLFCIT